MSEIPKGSNTPPEDINGTKYQCVKKLKLMIEIFKSIQKAIDE